MINLSKEVAIRRILGKVEIATIMKKIEGRKLKQTERNYLYRSIRPKLMAANILSHENILGKVNKDNREDDSLIEYNLSLYSYEMISVKRKRKRERMPIEDLIARILAKSSNVRFIEAIPVLLIKNNVDKFKLIELACKYGIKNKLGYMIETAAMIKPKKNLKELLSYLKNNKDKGVSFLAEGDYDFLSRTSPKRVKKWNLLGRFFDEDFIKIAKAQL
ncbi:hypothetical protein HYU07_00060 [Candidatus Woesearchaeota archaeon]|nr:hypothetical protein [Candidatus Woesearchaeota archaeon]